MSDQGFPMFTWAPVPVRTGIAVDGRVVVEGEGVRDGLEVITTGNETLMPGQPIIPPMKGPPGGGKAPGGGKGPDEGGR